MPENNSAAMFINIRYDPDNQKLLILDQRELPQKQTMLELTQLEQVWQAIKTLQVRGAPAIGIAAAWGIAMQMQSVQGTPAEVRCAFKQMKAYLASSRPTAVNLFWALERMQRCFDALLAQAKELEETKAALLAEAEAIQDEDAIMCAAIGEHALGLLRPGMKLLTHCNAGALATARYGTALAPIYLGQERGYRFAVYVDETRPLLQGSRLTAWELQQAGVDLTVICDNMAARVFSEFSIDAVLVGADRVAANGDTANKIGTQGLAILARAFNVPFYVLCPSSTVDASTPNGQSMVIEERDHDEVVMLAGQRIAPVGVKVYNPAFDVTPASLITAIITESGVFRYPYQFKV